MNNFTFHNPTRIHFGRGQIAALSQELPADARVLLLFGGGSIRTNGVLTQVRAALGRRFAFEFGGVEANPDYDTLMRAVAVAHEQRLDFVLAVGGGSVLDGAKFVCAAARFAGGDPWRILSEGAEVVEALPLGTVLTLPGTGSEANGAAVISRREIGEKLFFISPRVYPVFSVLDPETTFSLPERQIANGVADAFTHVLEQYLTYPIGADLQDRMAEAVLHVLVEDGPRTVAAPSDYGPRANIVWAATVALNGLLGAGVPQDWATHMIGHELTALHGIDHARTLAVVLPALVTVQQAGKRAKLLQLGSRVFGVAGGAEEDRVARTIEAVRGFYEKLGLPTRLAAHEVGPEVAPLVARRLAARGMTALGERQDITPERVEEILRLAA